MKKKIIFMIAAIAIFCAGYFGIFEMKKDGYDIYAFKGDTKYDGSYDTGRYNDPYIPSGSWDYTDSGMTYYK